MKKLNVTVWLLCGLFIAIALPSIASAEFVEINGGIKNEYEYEEYVFITGQPVLMKGEGKNIKVSIKNTNKGKTETYTLKLTGPNGATLNRKATYVYDAKYDATGTQKTNTITKATVTETIKIGSTTFKLSDYRFEESTITQMYPANEYFATSGNVRKTYTYKNLAGVDSKIIVNSQVRSEGYENFWGSVETQIVENDIVHGVGTDNETTSYVKNKSSHAKSKAMNYEENLASLSSFTGGWMTNVESETMSEYTYDFSTFNGNEGSVELNKEYMTTVERLPVAKYRDISKHNARQAIEKLYALGVTGDNSNFFSPNTPTLRYDFIVAIGKAIDIRTEQDGKTSSTGDKTRIFKDVSRTKKDYEYLVAAYNHGVTTGVNSTLFNPNSTLTRQQAAAMLVRALGLEGKAPDPGYKTNYSDDRKISNYARDAVYVAGEIGLMQGVNGKFNPQGKLTRAQSALVIERFLEYLEKDLKQNYREDIWFFE
ncbi:MAG: S-layer homology domain-containing protein [Lysinibacillus sp.]